VVAAAVVAAGLVIGLTRGSGDSTSIETGGPALSGTAPVPSISGPNLVTGAPIRLAAYRGRPVFINVWASWCVSCMEEHPVLVELSRQGLVPLYGLNYKDERAAAQAWLARNGDPYTLSMADPDGRVGIDYGVYGVSETYVIDKTGVIRYKQIGPVTPKVLSERILPLVRRLQAP